MDMSCLAAALAQLAPFTAIACFMVHPFKAICCMVVQICSILPVDSQFADRDLQQVTCYGSILRALRA